MSNAFDQFDPPSPPIIDIEGVAKVRMFSGFEKLSPNEQQAWADQIVKSNWRTKFAVPLAEGLAITFAVCLVVYGVVRAIGWVIGGFAASCVRLKWGMGEYAQMQRNSHRGNFLLPLGK